MRLKSIKQNKWWLAICVGLVFLLTISVYNIQTAKAGSLTVISDVMSRLKASEDADHTITFTIASAVDAGETIAITFPSDFDTTSVDFSDIDVTDDGADLTLAAAASGTTWGVAFGGTGSRTLTLTSDTGTMVAGSVVVFEIGTNAASGDQAINNATTAGNYVVSIAGTLGDTGQYAVYIVDNDQVGVTAAVDPTLSFSISDLAIGFGHFGSTAIRYATSDEAGDTSEPAVANPTKFTVSTNGDNGLTITVRDEGNGSNAGLWAAAPVSELIPAAASSDADR